MLIQALMFSDIQVDSRIVRYDSLLYAINNEQDMTRLQKYNPAFFNLFFYRILGLPSSTPDSLFIRTRAMLQAETFVELDQKIKNQYQSFDDIAQEWDQAMKYYKYYFNPTNVPDLYTVVTEFAYGSFIFPIDREKDGVGVSLDLFLGDSVNYPIMSKIDPNFSAYRARTFNRDHLIKKAMDAIIDDKLPGARQPDFIHHLIREGKKYYISDNLLPFVSDTAIWEYSNEQWQWVKDNEWNIYTFLITNELFFSRDRSIYVKLINPAPHTKDMPPEAPGRAVVYSGYKIVEEYMRRNPDTSLSQLIELDANEIFQAAKYKPRR